MADQIEWRLKAHHMEAWRFDSYIKEWLHMGDIRHARGSSVEPDSKLCNNRKFLHNTYTGRGVATWYPVEKVMGRTKEINPFASYLLKHIHTLTGAPMQMLEELASRQRGPTTHEWRNGMWVPICCKWCEDAGLT